MSEQKSVRVAWRHSVYDAWKPLETPPDIRRRIRWDEPVYPDIVRNGGRVAVWERGELVYFAAHSSDERARA